jgi:hypothetical protein
LKERRRGSEDQWEEGWEGESGWVREGQWERMRESEIKLGLRWDEKMVIKRAKQKELLWEWSKGASRGERLARMRVRELARSWEQG